MPCTPPPQSRITEQGSISYLFLLLAGILAGGISLSLFVGNQVAQQVSIQNAADSSALATAAHAAQGLNMIAVNNQAIAAALQINHSLLLVAHYHEVVTVLLSSKKHIIKDTFDIFNNPLNHRFQKIFDIYQKPGQLYLQTAMAATNFNTKIRDHWLKIAPMRGIQTGRLNTPGSVVITKQAGKNPLGLMAYENLTVATPKETTCAVTAITPKEGKDTSRDNFLLWLQGPLLANHSGNADAIIEPLNQLFTTIHKLLPIRIGFTKCGIALKSPWAMLLDMDHMEEFFGVDKETAGMVTGAEMASKLQFNGYIEDAWRPCHDIGQLMLLDKLDVNENLSTRLGEKYPPANITRAAMLKKMYTNRSDYSINEIQIPYATADQSTCEDHMARQPDAATNDACTKTFTVKEHSFVCPLWRNIKNDISDKKCSYWKKKKLHGVSYKVLATKVPRDSWQDRWSSYCQDYDAWIANAEANDDAIHSNEDPPALMLRNLGKQAEAFAKRINTKKNPGFGFMVIKNPANHDRFAAALHFSSLLYLPSLTPAQAQDSLQKLGQECRALGIRRIASNSGSFCDADTSSLQAFGPNNQDQNQAAPAGAKVVSGGLADLEATTIWQRSHWGIANAQTRYISLSASEPRLYGDLKHMQIFWPGWGVTLRHAMLSDFTGDNLMARTVDWLRGQQ